jgi:glycosyltransferase involved in cell wall biosynthesis
VATTSLEDFSKGGAKPMTLPEKKLSLVGRKWVYSFNYWKAKKLIPFELAIAAAVPGAPDIRRKYPDLHLRLTGDWYPRSGMGRVVRHMLRTLGLENCVTFTGPVDAETLASLLLKTNVFASPSWIDNSPNSIEEAMLVGTPCVVPFTGGLTTTLTPGETGLMYPPGDPALLAAAAASSTTTPWL